MKISQEIKQDRIAEIIELIAKGIESATFSPDSELDDILGNLWGKGPFAEVRFKTEAKAAILQELRDCDRRTLETVSATLSSSNDPLRAIEITQSYVHNKLLMYRDCEKI